MPDPAARRALDEIVAREDPGIAGVVLSGSAARGLATPRSDVDVYVIWHEDDVPTEVARSAAVDEIPLSLSALEQVPAFGTDGWWFRWSFAWATVLRDLTGGRVAAAVHRQATLTDDEQDEVLGHRLDGYLNLAYRALKADRDRRPLECRLDACESVPWMLDVVFALCGRVRPYNKYLAWELREHPLPRAEWSAERLTPQVQSLLDGDPRALRAAFASVHAACREHDQKRGDRRLSDTFAAWGDDLTLFGEGLAPFSG